LFCPSSEDDFEHCGRGVGGGDGGCYDDNDEQSKTQTRQASSRNQHRSDHMGVKTSKQNMSTDRNEAHQTTLPDHEKRQTTNQQLH
jgi:hypothetical protein